MTGLNETDFIEDSYILGGKLPGTGPSALRKQRDFERSLGEEVEIRLYKALNKQKEFTGILKAYDKGNCDHRNGRGRTGI